MPLAARTAHFQAVLRRLFGAAVPEPVAATGYTWWTDPWSGGCWAACGPGHRRRFQAVLGQPLGRLHLAGEHTAQDRPGFMEGAVESGERAAREIET